MSFSQPHWILQALLLKLHSADRHGVQHLLPAVLWPPCKQTFWFTWDLQVSICCLRCDFFFFRIHSSLLPMISCGSGWRSTQWWTSSRFRPCLYQCTWTGVGLVRQFAFNLEAFIFKTLQPVAPSSGLSGSHR